MEPVSVIEGAIPQNVNGMYCRNGPNPVYQNRLYHWFDGDAMLHNLRLDGNDGTAFYTNQFVPSIRHQLEQEWGEDLFPGLGEYTGVWGLLKILLGPLMIEPLVGPDFGRTSAPPNTACLLYRNKFYCLNEGNIPLECRILPNGSLQPVGYESFGGVLDYPVSAHPRIDDTTGNLLFHSYTVDAAMLKRDGPMKIGTYSASKECVETYFSPVPDQKYVSFAHNLLHTRDYMIIYDCSIHFDPKAMFEGGSFFRTNPEYNLRFGILPKTCTRPEDVTWFDTGRPGGIVHPLNSWQDEKDGTIVIWTPFCDNLVIDLESEDINRFSMVEFRLNPTTGEVTRELIDDSVNIEFSVAPAMGRFVRYGYTAIQDPSTPGEGSFTGFCKWDMLERKLADTVYFDGLGGEPVVIDSKDGDTIYVGAYAQKDDQSYFDLYHGETTERVARLKMPGRIPYGFHGLWIKGQDLVNHFDFHSAMEKKQEEEAS
jgi:9-cis-epoxycarotenoid dioxygenase